MVQVSALFTALAMAASVAAEGCYTGGEPFGDALAAVKQHIYNMCHGYSGNRGALQDVSTSTDHIILALSVLTLIFVDLVQGLQRVPIPRQRLRQP